MKDRNITEEEVEAVLADHDTAHTDQAGNHIYIGHPEGGALKSSYGRTPFLPSSLPRQIKQKARMATPSLEYDRDADAIYVRLRDESYAFGEDIDSDRRIDYSADRMPIGVELLNVSAGVNLDDLPERETLAKLLTDRSIAVFA